MWKPTKGGGNFLSFYTTNGTIGVKNRSGQPILITHDDDLAPFSQVSTEGSDE